MAIFKLNDSPQFYKGVDYWTDERLVGKRLATFEPHHPRYYQLYERVLRKLPAFSDSLVDWEKLLRKSYPSLKLQ